MMRYRRLRVDLISGLISEESVPEDIIRDFLGGRGLNAATLIREAPGQPSPLSPSNPLVVGVGPFAGTMLPTNGRHHFTARSPLTGIFGDSNAAGFWGAELRYAGYHQLVITGRADKPAYLLIEDGEARLNDASHLWGLNTWETEEHLKRDLGLPEAQVASIGPAGENMVRFASIINNLGRAAGRAGLGAIMGAKNLKAIVVRGTGPVGTAAIGKTLTVSREMTRHLESTDDFKIRSVYGTPALVELYNSRGILPTRNCQSGKFDGAEDIGGRRLLRDFVVKQKACFACPIHCSRHFRIHKGPHEGLEGEGPEFETLAALGSRCGLSDLETVLRANVLCNQLGLDTISTGGVISFLIECCQHGIIPPETAGGLDLRWGNPTTVLDLIDRIAHRKGIGNILAEGVARASRHIGGSAPYALHVKGMEPAEQEPRRLHAWGLGWAVSSRGACHLRAFPVAETTWPAELAEQVFGTADAADPLASKGKGRLVSWSENVSALADSLEMCKFAVMSMAMPLGLIARGIEAVLGLKYSEQDLLTIGERIVNLERLYNVRRGITRADDVLPPRFLREPLDGEAHEFPLDDMLDQYYQARGWDVNTGIPTAVTIERLGLCEYAHLLELGGKLGA